MISEIPESELPEAEAIEVAEPGESIEPLEAAGAVADSELPEDELAEEDEVVEAAEDSDADESDEADVGDEDEVADAGADDFDNLRLVEALLFASAEPLAPAQIARFLPEEVKLEPLLADLQTLYANRGVNLVKRGGRWAFRTAEDLGPRMELENKVVRKLSRVALETLAVIAYHQPVTRAEIEEIRGVALSKGTLDALLEIGWIRPKGRRKTPGRPVTWGTSEAFLDHFGLEGLDALPGVEELKAAGLLDTRPALTALSDRGLLPAAGEVAPEEVEDEDDEDDSEIIEGSEQELLEATFGEDMLPQEVDLSAEPTGAETPEAEMADAEDADADDDSDEDDADDLGEDDLVEGDGAEASAEDAETDEDADVVDDAAEGDVAEDEDADAAEESDDEPQRSTG
ncbi:MAG: hypothetical protein Tsb0032_12680 [Kiloniellaceae bacterium]